MRQGNDYNMIMAMLTIASVILAALGVGIAIGMAL